MWYSYLYSFNHKLYKTKHKNRYIYKNVKTFTVSENKLWYWHVPLVIMVWMWWCIIVCFSPVIGNVIISTATGIIATSYYAASFNINYYTIMQMTSIWLRNNVVKTVKTMLWFIQVMIVCLFYTKKLLCFDQYKHLNHCLTFILDHHFVIILLVIPMYAYFCNRIEM